MKLYKKYRHSERFPNIQKHHTERWGGKTDRQTETERGRNQERDGQTEMGRQREAERQKETGRHRQR